MPKPPLPPEFNEYLAQPNPSVIATLDEDGSPHTAATWYLWENGRVLVNMDQGRKRLEHLRPEPVVSITVLGKDDGYHQRPSCASGHRHRTALRGNDVLDPLKPNGLSDSHVPPRSLDRLRTT
jgi:hypothetical protein